MSHIPYNIKFKHNADFKVQYRFYNKDEGGREFQPFQGYRSDFWYENPMHTTNQVFMIWPEFENEKGDIILDTTEQIKESGTARMWICINKMRSYHKHNIHVGMKGYFMEGSWRVAECTVIEILDLKNNPTEPIVINGTQFS